MNETVKIVFGLMGGLALFLFGMNSMSDALQKAAGEKMKQILGFLTRNPILGALAGALVTAVLQSSSATTVMVIGFVSAGLMSLPQGISVIFGANIGTTITAQLLTLKISDYIYPIIFVGFLMNFVLKSEKLKSVGTVIFSFGLLFEGIEIMGGVMKPLAGSPIFIDLMGKVSQIPVLGILLGAGMTLVVQSSSATIAVLQNFASQAGPDGVTSVIGLAGAIPILLGDNIGTTITALLATIGQSKNAKRTALAHSIFNISGSILFVCVIPWFTQLIRFISPKGNEVDVISSQIANAHTTFNVLCTLIWLPLIPVMIKLVTWIVRGKDPREELFSRPQFLDDHVLGQPAAAMYLASQELSRCGRCTMEMLDAAKEELTGPSGGQFDARYKTMKRLQEQIGQYLTRLFSGGGLTEAQAERTAGLLFVNNNLDRIADRCTEVVGIARRLRGEKKSLSSDAARELIQCFARSQNMFEQAMTAVERGEPGAARAVSDQWYQMRKAEREFSKAHLERVKKGVCNPALTADFTSMLYSMDRLADNCIAIAEEALDHVNFSALELTRAGAVGE